MPQEKGLPGSVCRRTLATHPSSLELCSASVPSTMMGIDIAQNRSMMAWAGPSLKNIRNPVQGRRCQRSNCSPKHKIKHLKRDRSPSKNTTWGKTNAVEPLKELLRPALQLDILDLVVALPDAVHHPVIQALYYCVLKMRNCEEYY